MRRAGRHEPDWRAAVAAPSVSQHAGAVPAAPAAPALVRLAVAPALAATALAALCAGGFPSPAAATIDASFHTDQPIKVGQVGIGFVKVNAELVNTGTEPDTYDVIRDRSETPLTWDVSICVGGEDGTCYAPFIDEILGALSLNPGENDTLSLYFTPLAGEGSGYATLTVRSQADPGVERALTMGCVTDGCDVLIVDDDEAAAVEAYFEDAIPPPLASGTWRRELSPPQDALQGFGTTVWLTGAGSNTLDAADRQAIAAELDAGGRLFVSGQDIAFDLCDPASPNYSPASRAWFETWLHGTYLLDDSGSLALDPVPGDAIAQGLPLTITGGDGASNQTDPDVVAPRPGAASAWIYSGGGGGGGSGDAAALRIVGGAYRAVLFTFGFEAIATQADRDAVMARVLDWLDDPLIGIGDAGAHRAPQPLLLEAPRPNPFNPEVAVAFSLALAGPTRLRIVDPAGRTVRTLLEARLGAGRHVERWDGRGDGGRRLASGVYFIHLRAGGRQEVRKVVLNR